MSSGRTCDDDLLRRLPLPLALLYVRAHNTKNPLDKFLTAYYLWEASLKLLASVAVVTYAARPERDPGLDALLQRLARPSLGHWWELVKKLVPVLAAGGDAPFQRVQGLLSARKPKDLGRVAELDAVLRAELAVAGNGPFQVEALFDRLVQMRNDVLGHGAVGQHRKAFYSLLSGTLLDGMAQLLVHLDVLAGRRLVYLAEVSRRPSGAWFLERYLLTGETARAQDPLELPGAAPAPVPGQIYLELPERPPEAAGVWAALPLHPLVVYEDDQGGVLFLNRHNGRRLDYLCYATGGTVQRGVAGDAPGGLLGQLLGTSLARGEADPPAPGPAAEAAPDGQAVVADRPEHGGPYLGDFALLSELGRGTMGVVYRARQPSLQREVALKRLLRTGDRKAEARFGREVRALAAVDHPNLVKIISSGSDRGQWFYTMELVEGASLAAVFEKLQARPSGVGALDLDTWQEAVSTVCEESRQAEKALDDLDVADVAPAGPAVEPPPSAPPPRFRAGRDYVRRVADLVRQVAEAAHALHEAGVIHRDIKPANILVKGDDARAVLMDLGLAQLFDEPTLTASRHFLGTPRYASPEQVQALGQRLDPRSDVYSLGVILWELLTLRPMYGATRDMPVRVLMNRVAEYEDPESVRRYQPRLAADLDAIVQKCLHKNPKRRYGSAADLAADLRRFLVNEPVQARPLGRLRRGLKWLRRRRTETAVVTLVGLALGGLAAGGLWERQAEQHRRRAEELTRLRDEAEEHRRDAEEQRARADVLRDLAEQKQRDADARSREARRFEYVAEKNLAQRAWLEGDVPLVLGLLRQQEPRGNGLDDLRGFEWHHLWHLCHAERLTLRASAGHLHAVAYSPDGLCLAAAGSDGTVKVWDAAGGTPLATLRGHVQPAVALAFSPDGARLASGGWDGVVLVWDAARARRGGAGEPVFKLRHAGRAPGNNDGVNGVAFSPDGNYLASAGADGLIRVWDAATGHGVGASADHTAAANAVAYSPDGKHLASAGDDGTVRLWDAATRQGAGALHGHDGRVLALAYSHDGRRLASAGADRTVRVWDPGKGTEERSLKAHQENVCGVAFSPDDTRLASAGWDGKVAVWDAAGGQQLVTLQGHADHVTAVAFSPDGHAVASAGYDDTVKVWDPAHVGPAVTLRVHAEAAAAVAYAPDGRRLASASLDGSVVVWDATTGDRAFLLPGHGGGVSCVAYSPDGACLASGSFDAVVRLWDAATGQERGRLDGHADQVTGLAFSPDGRLLASSSQDKTVRLWDVVGHRMALPPFRGHGTPVYGVAFSPNGRLVASAGGDGVKVWDARTGRELRTFTRHGAAARAVAFGPDGELVASASGDYDSDPRARAPGEVKVWKMDSGEEVFTFRGHTTQVTAVAFSPFDKRLASAGEDGLVKLWDLSTGQQTLKLAPAHGGVLGLAFSPDGKSLATAHADGAVQQWR